MNSFWIFALVILNFGISWFNAWAVGTSWAEAKAVGGFPLLLAWCGATMSACGFTWVYLVGLCALALKMHWLTQHYAQAMFSLGYIIIILPVLGSGLGITIQSWAMFWRRRTIGNGAAAGYNTLAQLYNTWEAVRVLPDALHDVGDLLKSDDEDSKGMGKVVFILVAFAILGGILTTTAILRHTARVHAELKGAAIRYVNGLSVQGNRTPA